MRPSQLESTTESINESPLKTELLQIFAQIPEDDLAPALKTHPAGRPGYGWRVLWRTCIAMTYMNLPSFAALRRHLQDNPALREACGIRSSDGIPSTFAYSRFMAKFRRLKARLGMKDVFRFLVRRLNWKYQDFGKSVAIDATTLKAWSNGAKPNPSDQDAGWSVKKNSHGKTSFTWGYKLHVMCDAVTELPISAAVTAGNVADIKRAPHLLSEARTKAIHHFNAKYVIADKGYSSDDLRNMIRNKYHAMPVISTPINHIRAREATPFSDPEWKAAYNLRGSVERIFSRLKQSARLNNITVRGLNKVTAHCYFSLIVTNAVALARPEAPRSLVRAA